MKIEEGKFYRTRDGHKVGPMIFDSTVTDSYPYRDPDWSGWWSEGGERQAAKFPETDLIAEWEDTPAKPKTWGEMTGEEKGALLLAEYEGDPIQALALDHDGSSWVRKHLKSQWFDHVAYRVKPEPEVETVTLYSFRPDEEFGNEYRDTDTHRITFDLIDGKPDCASIKMEEI
jgi:hypothetical protein